MINVFLQICCWSRSIQVSHRHPLGAPPVVLGVLTEPCLFFRAAMSAHESELRPLSPELPAMFDGVKLAAVATVLYVLVRCLNLKSPTAPPDLTYQDTPLTRFLLKSCGPLTKEWVGGLCWVWVWGIAMETADVSEVLIRWGSGITPMIGLDQTWPRQTRVRQGPGTCCWCFPECNLVMSSSPREETRSFNLPSWPLSIKTQFITLFNLFNPDLDLIWGPVLVLDGSRPGSPQNPLIGPDLSVKIWVQSGLTFNILSWKHSYLFVCLLCVE